MQKFTGNVIAGEFSDSSSDFYVTNVKHLVTQSKLSKTQLEQLSAYLEKHKVTNESCTVTVNDQLPILLQADEVSTLQNEIKTVLERVR